MKGVMRVPYRKPYTMSAVVTAAVSALKNSPSSADILSTKFQNVIRFRQRSFNSSQIPVTEHQLQSLCSRFGRLGDPDSVSYEDLFFFAQSAMPELSTTRCDSRDSL